MVKMLEQLSKLGVFKSKKTKRRKSKVVDEIKQESDLVGYAKSLGSPLVRNIPALQQIQPGMTLQQIEDIQERNNAAIAALQGEIQQQRLQDIEAQQGQRLADIEMFGTILNPVLERFRGAQEPGAGQRPNPFSTGESLPALADISEGSFTQTLNEGGPQTKTEIPTTTFAETGEEEEGIPLGGGSARMGPVEKISREQQPTTEFFKSGGATSLQKIKKGKPTRNEFLELNGLGPLPPNTKKTTLATMLDYYTDFSQVFALDLDGTILSNKDAMYKDMRNKIDDLINLSI
jgi:hypothetical protein